MFKDVRSFLSSSAPSTSTLSTRILELSTMGDLSLEFSPVGDFGSSGIGGVGEISSSNLKIVLALNLLT